MPDYIKDLYYHALEIKINKCCFYNNLTAYLSNLNAGGLVKFSTNEECKDFLNQYWNAKS